MQGKALQRLLAAVVMLGVAGLALWWTLGRPQPMRFSLRFEEAQGLTRGHKVLYKGVVVGEVEKVELTAEKDVRVTLVLQEAHRELAREGATGYVTKNSLVSVTNEKSVELYNADEKAKPLAPGAELPGVNGYLELQRWKAARWGAGVSKGAGAWYDRAVEGAKEMLEGARESFQDKAKDPEIEQFLTELQRMAEGRMEDMDRALPELEQRYRQTRAALRGRGEGELAEKLQSAWDQFLAKMDAARNGK